MTTMTTTTMATMTARRDRAGSVQGPPIRQGRARAVDVRLWAGVLLVIVAMVAGAWVLGRHDDSVSVWRVVRDAGPGATPQVEPVRLPRALAEGGYLLADDPPVGRLRWPLAAGALLPAAAMDTGATPDLRRVTVPIDPRHAPVGLAPGAVVDAWQSDEDPAGRGEGAYAAASDGARLVLEAVTVAEVADDPVGLGGELAVVLEVDADEVPALVDAARSGALDLVLVPMSAQAAFG